MFNKASGFEAGDVTQINAGSYRRSGGGTKSVKVRGDYKNTTEINAQEYHHHETSSSGPVKDLYAHVAVGCMHNSADRVVAPKCHKKTRQAVQHDIFSWISNGDLDEVLWLTGPAGTGKSAIMGTISDKLKEKGQLAATYYFSSFAGSLERQSKRGFVTTLAYQLQQCEGLGDGVSLAILTAVERDPAVFRLSLKEQVERLILRPLRGAQRSQSSAKSGPAMTILVDGVDECGEGQYINSDRSREDDQIEVLSVLLQASRDPAFPFRVIIASRPETWIRRFFADAALRNINEIFLDGKYKPDDDIRLFLQSKFAELCRRHHINPSMWPTEEVMEKLVEAASGQFIYAATVLRFVNTPPLSPQAQLEVVLKIKPPQDASNPFSVLDALYTSILRSSRSPSDTVIRLKALQLLRSSSTLTTDLFGRSPAFMPPSSWTIDRLFEGGAGPAMALLELPSLVYICEGNPNSDRSPDSLAYGVRHRLSPLLIPEVGWNATYDFYHKSFIDYLGDPSRCGVIFPDANKARVESWIGERCTRTLMCGGPEVSIRQGLLLIFQRCFLDILTSVLNHGALRRVGIFKIKKFKGDIVLDDAALSQCRPSTWLDVSRNIPSEPFDDRHFLRVMCGFVHRNCGIWCKPGCKLWRRAIYERSPLLR